MNTQNEPQAVFGTTKKNIAGVLNRAQTMQSSITENASTFMSLPITMVAFEALVAALVTSQVAVTGTRAKGAAQTRNSKRNALWTAMLSLKAYIQGLANSLSHDDAETLIKSAGLVVAKAKGSVNKPVLTATLTSVLGNVHLEANRTVLVGKADARKQLFFNWEMSANGGQTWTALPSTPYASTEVTGLTALTTYSFRVSVTGKVTQPWSQIVSVLVH